ncbi:Hypothetical protein CINCED_3A025604 [Cinara cedri]|uniref:SANTA domain-containing protein n=1 Tax=Cinara cedri TaxID=506608 RepID=A0A5E4MQH3_9HEMI|nr:Hypothetical protein CINCED_3A025604 [Cinara cedri]
MANQQTSFRTFEVSVSVQPSNSETLLFHDILEEKSLALRNALKEFLKTHPYRLFDSEFSTFLNRLNRIGNVERNTTSNALRSTTMAESNPVNPIPNPISNMPIANNNSANGSQIIGESNIEPNPFRPHLGDISKTHHLATMSEYNDRIIMKDEPLFMNINAASQLTQNQPDEDDEDDEDDEKYLNKWCVKLEEIKSGPDSTFIIKLFGVLVKKDLVKVLEKDHCAGILKFRKNKNLVQTDKGLYNLIGPIRGGLPNNLFLRCLEAKGIPRTWKHFLTRFYNFRIIKKKVPVVNVNKSFTRSGTVYNKNISISGIEKSDKKRKHSEEEGLNLKKIKSDNIHKELSIASTSKNSNGINTTGDQKTIKGQKSSNGKKTKVIKNKGNNIRKKLSIASTSKKSNGIKTTYDKKTKKGQKSSNSKKPNLKKIKNDNIRKKSPIASTSKKLNGVNTTSDQKTNKQQKSSEDEVSNLRKIKNDNIRRELLIATASKKFNKINTPAQYLKYKFHQKLIKTCSLMTKATSKMGLN